MESPNKANSADAKSRAADLRRYLKPMKIGNILASLGIVLCFLGFISLPFWNLHELPHMADPAYPRGSGWILLVQTGIFARPGFILLALGGLILLISKLLPKKYWENSKSYSRKKREKSIRRKNKIKNIK